jgi:hypothetical protein
VHLAVPLLDEKVQKFTAYLRAGQHDELESLDEKNASVKAMELF